MPTASHVPPGSEGAFNIRAQAQRAASTAARRAGVTVRELEDMEDLREVSALLESVWGRSAEGVPVHSEMLRSLVHAGGCVTGAYDAVGRLVGGAALTVAAPAGATYSLIAAASPSSSDKGIGRAVKLRQRAWALDRDYTSMVWTFDPLVSRNARFNLVKLGASVTAYEVAFYGRMSDAINGDDEADRLVATWRLDSRRAVAASEGTTPEVDAPGETSELLADGPDGRPMLRRDERGLWCRVPWDVVALRKSDPGQASTWRMAVREAFARAIAAGGRATHMTRDGWYLLTTEEFR
jgi:predicted GNAT superfamily acetyltransferase